MAMMMMGPPIVRTLEKDAENTRRSAAEEASIIENTWYGSNYSPDRSMAEIATLVRANILNEIKSGELPDLKYIVSTTKNYDRQLKVTTKPYRESMKQRDPSGTCSVGVRDQIQKICNFYNRNVPSGYEDNNYGVRDFRSKCDDGLTI